MKKAELEKLGLTAEAIEKAGLEEDVVDKILALHGKGIETLKAKAETDKVAAEALEAQLAEANKAIDGFKKLDPEGIKKAAADWEAKAKENEALARTAKEDADKRVATLNFDHTLEGALVEAKVKNAKAVKALLKLDDLKLAADGSIVGLTEQLGKVKADNDYLFSDTEAPPKVVTGGNAKSIIGDAVVEAARQGAGLKPSVAKENKS